MRTSLRIAIADDELDMREYLERLLPRLGHQVVASASSGAELVRAVEQTHPDLIITDVRMTQMDGDEALAVIWAREIVPAVVISAYDRPDSLIAPQGVALAYITKPVRGGELVAAIEAVFAPTDEQEDDHAS